MKKKQKLNIEGKSKIAKRTVLFSAAFLMIIVGVVILYSKNRTELNRLNTENIELGGIITERDSLVNELIGAFDEIEQNLTFINERRSQLVIENREFTYTSKKESIIEDIQRMNVMLEENRLKIKELENKLKNSGIQLKSFKNKVASLNKRIAQQNRQIVDLKLQIEDQNTRLILANHQKDSLQNEIIAFRDSIEQNNGILVQQEEVIVQQTLEINKGYFAYGTFRELANNGVVAKEGGFMGIGRNKILQENINHDYFTKIDKEDDRTIPLNVRKVKLISNHPADSYKLIEEDGLITKLEIETPEDFWRMSPYAVIEVKL